MKRIILLVLGLSILCIQNLPAQKAPFYRGVNLTNWFQAGSAQQIQFSKYTFTDFEQIKSLGCDVVRLPINLHFMTNGTPDYQLDPLFLNFLDQVVDWTTELDLHLILDNHTFSVEDDTDPNVGIILEKVWSQMAAHYLNAYDQLYFEVLNEPHGISDAQWNAIQQKVVEAIRKVNTKHTIVIGPASWNSYNNLKNMPVYNDDKLIYTFHFYDPFVFTHQGASWTEMTDLGGVPFPYAADQMPAFPATLKGTWIESAFNDYKNTGTVAEVKRLIDIAVKFGQERNVPLYCGEFGVYDLKSPDPDRTYWYGVVREHLEANNIAWTIWDYHGGFGLYRKGSNGMFYHDLNVEVCEQLGLTPPEQTPFVPQADTVGFHIYRDYPGTGINSSGAANFYSTYRPNNDAYCIEWSNATQYSNLAFNFKPTRDLSLLVENGFALDFLIRGTDPAGSFDVRFVDSDTGDDDHPWRNRVVIDKSRVEWDGQWQHVHIPLKDFREHGAWENAWYNPEGLFDWKAVDRLEIVAESRPMGDFTIGIDNIVITNLDTANVRLYTGIPTFNKATGKIISLRQHHDEQVLELVSLSEDPLELTLYLPGGQVVSKACFHNRYSLSTRSLNRGLYLLLLRSGQQIQLEKILIR